MVKILDCTIRDGGYYTNWDFDRNLVDTYVKACNYLPVEYLEVGYRSITLEGYYGEYFYLPLYVMQRLKAQTTKKLVVILNEKDIRPEQVQELLSPCIGLIDMVRLAIDPKQFVRAIELAKAVKEMGFEVGFNVMYMSKWKGQKDFLELLPKVKGIADYFYMVDSYGGVFPQDVKDTIQLVKSYIPDIPLGFHGHNNMELALINTLTAIDEGCEIVDATITGMGRGAGNVKTELLLTALNAQGKLEVDFNPLSKVVDVFTELQKKHEWGTNLPYMVSGAHSLPQKDVMDWVGKRYYSFNSIIRALQNQAKGFIDNISIRDWENKLSSDSVLIVGGGNSVKEHKEAIIQFLNLKKNVMVIHASSKNALTFKGVSNQQIFCLVGNEGHRMEDIFNGDLPLDTFCVLPPSPRKMGTYIPSKLIENSYQLNLLSFTGASSENVTALALEVAIRLNAKNVYVVGYDGYSENINENQIELFNENEELFKSHLPFFLQALTTTKYTKINFNSVYAYL
jgi:4-hydroxy 2-oxovalerate aldolase